MRFLSARQAVTDAYSGKLGTVWDPGVFGDVDVARRLYCPHCRNAGLKHLGERPVLEDGQPVVRKGQPVMRQTWRCGPCRRDITRPLAMMPRGSARPSSNAGANDNDYRICDALEAAEVMAVVERLPSVGRVWLLYAYTETQSQGLSEGALLDWLCDRLDADPPCDVAGLGALKKALTLLLLLIQESRAINNGAPAPWTEAQLAGKIGVNRSQFDKGRHWGRFVAGARRELERLNSEALGPVGALVERMRAKSEVAA